MNYRSIIGGLLLLSTSLLANPSMEEFLSGQKSNEQSGSSFFEVGCQYTLEGCSDDLDYLKGPYERYLDDLYACTRSYYGCTSEEQQKIDQHEISMRGISSRQLSELIKKYDPLKTHKGYFIPLGLTDRELLTFAAATSLGLVVFANDGEIMDFVQEHKTEKTAQVANVANLFGRELIPPVALGAYFLGAVFDNGQLKQVGLFTVTAGLATQLVTEGFKKSFNRVRPNGEQGPYAFGVDGNNSFFSGHSSAAWSFATVISEVYKKDHEWVPYVAYGMAALTSYARVHDQKHWMTDVLAGAVMGHLITKAVIRMHLKDDSEGGLMVFPSYDSQTGTTTINIYYTPKQPKSEFYCARLPDGPEKIRACIEEAFERSK